MNSGIILLVILGALVLMGVGIVAVFRFVTRKLGIKELVDEGVLLTDSGIEFPRFPFMRRGRARYDEIESVELVPFPQNLLLRMRYGPSVASNVSAQWLGLFREAVVVKLRPPRLIQYYMFTPSDPVALANELKSRIQRGRSS